MKTLHLNLKKEWFDKIKSGEKTVEYREAKPYWTTRLKGKMFDKIIFKNGYGLGSATIEKKFINIKVIPDGLMTDLKINKPVYAIYFKSMI